MKKRVALLGVGSLVMSLMGMVSGTAAVDKPEDIPMQQVPGVPPYNVFLTLQGIPGAEGPGSDQSILCASLNLTVNLFEIDPEKRVLASDLVFRKPVDRTSPLLVRACAAKQPIKQAVFRLHRNFTQNPNAYYTVTLDDVTIKSVKLSVGASGASEEITLEYRRVLLRQGETSAGVDRTAAKPIQ